MCFDLSVTQVFILASSFFFLKGRMLLQCFSFNVYNFHSKLYGHEPDFMHLHVFQNESALRIRQPEYWSFSFSISPSKEYSGLTTFRFDLLAVHRILKSLLQHHSSKASILPCSSFFIVQLSHPYMTTGKTIAFFSLLFHFYICI